MNRSEFRLSEFVRQIRKWGGGVSVPDPLNINDVILIGFQFTQQMMLDPITLDDINVRPADLADHITRRILHEMKDAVDKKLVEFEQERFDRIHATTSVHPAVEDPSKAPEAGR